MSASQRTVLAAAALGLLLATGATAQSADADAVRSLFGRYKEALVGGDGAAAAALVDADTLGYFDDVKGLALRGSEEEVRQRPFVDRLLIVTMRHELQASELESMDLQGLLEHAIDAGWIGKQSIGQLGIGEVTVEGDEAFAVALTPNLRPPGLEDPPEEEAVAPLRYRFVREGGEWKFGFRSLVESINKLLTDITAQMGTNQDTLIFVLVEQISGRKVLPEVWSTPGGGGPAPTPAP